MYNASLETISVLEDSDEKTIVQAGFYISDLYLPVKLYYMDVNVSILGYEDPAIRIFINNTINLEMMEPHDLEIYVTIFKTNEEHIRELLRMAIESDLRAIKICGETKIEIFGVNLTLPFEFENMSMTPTTSQLTIGATLPGVAFKMLRIDYLGETYIDNKKAYVLSLSTSIDNFLGISFGVGPFEVDVVRDNEVVIEIDMPHQVFMDPYSETTLNVTMYFFSSDKTYEFLRDLIENYTLNATINGHGNISVFGIDIPNIDISYNILSSLRREVAGSSVGSIPFPEISVDSYEIGVIDEDDERARLYVETNFTNDFVIPFELWYLNISLTKDNERAISMMLDRTLDLNSDRVSTSFFVTIYKTNATINLIRELVCRKVTGVGVGGNAKFMFLEWNFTIDIDVENMSYSSSGQGGAIAPLGFDEVISVRDIRQISSMGVRVYLRFRNIVNTTVGFGRLNFDVFHDDVRVIYAEMSDYYLIGPEEEENITVDIYFENVSETQEFLSELLVNRAIDARVEGIVDISIFGLNITRISISEYLFLSFSDVTTNGQIGEISLPSLLRFELNNSEDLGSYLEISSSVVLGSSPISFKITNLHLKLENEYGRFGELIIPNMVGKYSQNITGDIILRLYRIEPNRPLEKFIRDVVERNTLDIHVYGQTDIEIFGFLIRGIPLDFTLNQSLETTGGETSSFTNILLPMEQLLIFDSVTQKTFGPGKYDLAVDIRLRSPLDTSIILGDMNFTVMKSSTEIIDIVSKDIYEIVSDDYTDMELNISMFDVAELHDFIEEVIVQKRMNITIFGSVDIGLLGAYIDDIKINYTIAQSGGSDNKGIAQTLIGFSGLGRGSSIDNITYLGEDVF
ncbi:MAG: hypothetical protein DRO65_04510, partial [Candidatus Altiarchaeales archaeon]